MAKTRTQTQPASPPLNRFAVERHIRSAQQLHDEGLLSDMELKRIINDIDERRHPGFGSGGDLIENAHADLAADMPSA